MFVLYKCIFHCFVNLRNIFNPSDQSNFLKHGTQSCKSKRQCLEHRHDFQHEKAAALATLIVSFCTWIFYLLTLMQGSEEE